MAAVSTGSEGAGCHRRRRCIVGIGHRQPPGGGQECRWPGHQPLAGVGGDQTRRRPGDQDDPEDRLRPEDVARAIRPPALGERRRWQTPPRSGNERDQIAIRDSLHPHPHSTPVPTAAVKMATIAGARRARPGEAPRRVRRRSARYGGASHRARQAHPRSPNTRGCRQSPAHSRQRSGPRSSQRISLEPNTKNSATSTVPTTNRASTIV